MDVPKLIEAMRLYRRASTKRHNQHLDVSGRCDGSGCPACTSARRDRELADRLADEAGATELAIREPLGDDRPSFSIHDDDAELVAYVFDLRDGAAILAARGDTGWRICVGAHVIWHEGHEEISAKESPEAVAALCLSRTRPYCLETSVPTPHENGISGKRSPNGAG